MTTVFIADDHPVVLSGLKSFVDNDPNFSVVGTAPDGRAAIEGILAVAPDLAIIDLNMPLAGGLEVLISLRQRESRTRIVVMAAAAADADVHALIASGAEGLLFKESAVHELLDCLRAVAAGQQWMSPAIVAGLKRHEQRATDWQRALKALTQQERRIAALAGAGQSNKQIAFALQLSEGTVKVHLNSIFRKLDLTSRNDLIQRAAGLDGVTGR
jgi:two-component system nitrate/nitrite response regulator NarL